MRTAADAQMALRDFANDWRTGRFYVFGIWHRATDAYLGDICLMPQQKGQAEIGYYLAASAEGHGYAREALAAVVTFGFETVGSQRLLVRCFQGNERGQAVARAVGFQGRAAAQRPAGFATPTYEQYLPRLRWPLWGLFSMGLLSTACSRIPTR